MKAIQMKWISLLVLTICVGLVQVAHAAEDFRGNWTLMKSEQKGEVRFGLSHRMHGGQSQHESDWPVNAFQGLDLSAAGKHDVVFTITRDAGRFDCEGYLRDGEGAGIFRFTPNASFARDMSAIGFGGIDEEKQFAMAVHDVTLEFARSMKAEKLIGLDTDKLIAFRIFGVTPKFINDMRAERVPALDADKLIAFRVHGVSPEMARELRKAGIDIDEDQLIAFRVHGVSPDFVNQVESLGFDRPSPDQLIAMRIHGVTPEYISTLKSRGVKDLSIDQLITLRVHGID